VEGVLSRVSYFCVVWGGGRWVVEIARNDGKNKSGSTKKRKGEGPDTEKKKIQLDG